MKPIELESRTRFWGENNYERREREDRNERTHATANYLSVPAFVEVKMNKSFKSKQSIGSHSLSEKLTFVKHLREVWQDFQDDPHWKYEQLAPVQLLEKSEVSIYLRYAVMFAV